MSEPTPAKLVPASDAANRPDPDFDALLQELADLSLHHLLFFRVHVGRTLSFAFFGNDRAGFYDRTATKPNSFRRFCRERAHEIADLGLSEDLLRKCILAWFVVEDLPEAVTRQLKFSHVVALAPVDDPATRRLLAQAAVENAWTGDALKDAVTAARAGRWIDADPNKPGLQPPEPAPAPPARLAPGRVVTRFEKALEDFGDLATHWDGVPIERLQASQLERVDASLTALEGHIAGIRARLASART